MSGCTAQYVSCDCNSTSLAQTDIALPKTGDDLPFRALVAGTGVQIDQSENKIYISALANWNRPVFYQALVPVEFTDTTLMGPLPFTDTSVYGAINTIGPFVGNELTITQDGGYHFEVQLTTALKTGTYSTAQFDREVKIYINGSQYDYNYNFSFSNETTTICISGWLNLVAGDKLSIYLLAGPNSTTNTNVILGGPSSYFSVTRLPDY